MAEAASSGNDAMAVLRHDLRAPLNQIIGYAELVAEDLQGDGHRRAREDLDKIGRAARSLAGLITREIQPGRVVLVGDGGGTRTGAAEEKSPGVSPPPNGVEEGRVSPAPAAPARILIVDDEPENCAVLQRRLEKDGHVCVPVHDGETALARLAAEPFDLVLLDIVMSGVDGREVLRRIKGDKALRHLPVIMISALDQIERVAECIEWGAEDYLPKPFNPVLLRARIGASLDRKRLRDGEQEAFAALQESQRRLAAELTEAASYVQGVLPAPLTAGPVLASWEFRPSSSLGGDAFGYGLLDEETFGVYLLDVCGHGVGAALLSISVLNVIRAESLPDVDFRDPGAVLAGLNAAFPMERHGEMFFTAWCGMYHIPTRTMRFAAGGHPPPVMVEADGSAGLLAARGPVVGAMEGARFAAQERIIPPDSRVFIFSDGAYEIMRADGTMMSHGDLAALLARAPERDAVPWVMERLQDLNTREAFDDDVSFVELRFP